MVNYKKISTRVITPTANKEINRAEDNYVYQQVTSNKRINPSSK